MVHSFLLAHGRQVLWVYEHTEEVVEWVGLDEELEASGVETEGTECVGEGGEHLPRHRDLCEGVRVCVCESVCV